MDLLKEVNVTTALLYDREQNEIARTTPNDGVYRQAWRAFGNAWSCAENLDIEASSFPQSVHQGYKTLGLAFF